MHNNFACAEWTRHGDKPILFSEKKIQPGEEYTITVLNEGVLVSCLGINFTYKNFKVEDISYNNNNK